MDIATILALVEKGMTVIGALIAAGESAAPAISAISNLVTGAKAGTVTDDQLDATEKLLDDQIAQFDLEIP